MRVIEIAALSNGAHNNGDQAPGLEICIPDGWALIPDGTETPNFPFGTFDVEMVDGVPTMKNWVAGTMAEPVTPKLAEVQAAKLTEINAACEAAITSGCDVKLSDGTAGHISLTIPDQINLSTAQEAIKAGGTGYAYHLDGALCEVYPAADIAIMAKAATAHVMFHQTYCNHTRAWVKRCTAIADVEAVTYGAVLPDDLAQHMATVLGGGNA